MTNLKNKTCMIEEKKKTISFCFGEKGVCGTKIFSRLKAVSAY